MLNQFVDVPIDVSFVIPARNEELLIARTLASLGRAAEGAPVTVETIVVDDGSTDCTPQIAAECGARVVSVQLHNIAAVRNAGAAVARGKYLFFLDADTLLPRQTFLTALAALNAGCVGGGAAVEFESMPSRFHRLLAVLFTFYWQRIGGWAAGCSIFVTREAFEYVGGFDVRYFAAEEKVLSQALRRMGRVVILREPVITSARKVRLYSLWRLIRIATTVLLGGEDRLKRREGLEILYDAPRETAVQDLGARIQESRTEGGRDAGMRRHGDAAM